MNVVVIGAGVGGLAAALGLARDGHEVLVLERDRAAVPADAVDAFEWPRPGTPQARLHHTFLARTRVEFDRHVPDAVALLLEAGAIDRDLLPQVSGPRDGDSDLRVLLARRPVVEWALRSLAERQDGLEIRSDVAVVGLELERTTVVGVGAAGESFAADLVVDAGGRRSPVRGFFEQAGFPLPPVQTVSCGIGYASRYFRLRDGVSMPDVRGPIIEGANLGYLGYAIGPADQRTFSVVFAFASSEPRLRALRHREAWDAGAAMIERIAIFVDRDVGEPLMDPTPMFGLQNVLTPWLVDGVPVVQALATIGDAWVTTDPFFGWGASLAISQGFELAAAVKRRGSDVSAAVEDYAAQTATEVIQRFATSCSDDRGREAQWAGEADDRAPIDIEREALLFALGRLARNDPAARDALLRRSQLLALPDDIWNDHELVDRARAELLDHPYDPTRTLPGPDCESFIESIEAAVARSG